MALIRLAEEAKTQSAETQKKYTQRELKLQVIPKIKTTCLWRKKSSAKRPYGQPRLSQASCYGQYQSNLANLQLYYGKVSVKWQLVGFQVTAKETSSIQVRVKFQSSLALPQVTAKLRPTPSQVLACCKSQPSLSLL